MATKYQIDAALLLEILEDIRDLRSCLRNLSPAITTEANVAPLLDAVVDPAPITSPLPPTPLRPPDPPDLSQSDLISATRSAQNIIKASLLSNATSKTSKNKVPQRYTCEQVYERMESGLCLFCDEHDTPDHYILKHKRCQVVMVEHDDDSVALDQEENFNLLEKNVEHLEIKHSQTVSAESISAMKLHNISEPDELQDKEEYESVHNKLPAMDLLMDLFPADQICNDQEVNELVVEEIIYDEKESLQQAGSILLKETNPSNGSLQRVHKIEFAAELELYMSGQHSSRKQKWWIKEFAWFQKLQKRYKVTRRNENEEPEMVKQANHVWDRGGPLATCALGSIPVQSDINFDVSAAQEEERLCVMITYEMAETLEKQAKTWRFKFKSKSETRNLTRRIIVLMKQGVVNLLKDMFVGLDGDNQMLLEGMTEDVEVILVKFGSAYSHYMASLRLELIYTELVGGRGDVHIADYVKMFATNDPVHMRPLIWETIKDVMVELFSECGIKRDYTGYINWFEHGVQEYVDFFKDKFLQRIPVSIESIFKVGDSSPAAWLRDVWDPGETRFLKAQVLTSEKAMLLDEYGDPKSQTFSSVQKLFDCGLSACGLIDKQPFDPGGLLHFKSQPVRSESVNTWSELATRSIRIYKSGDTQVLKAQGLASENGKLVQDLSYSNPTKSNVIMTSAQEDESDGDINTSWLNWEELLVPFLDTTLRAARTLVDASDETIKPTERETRKLLGNIKTSSSLMWHPWRTKNCTSCALDAVESLMLHNHNNSVTKALAQWKEHPPDRNFTSSASIKRFILEDKDVLKKGVL